VRLGDEFWNGFVTLGWLAAYPLNPPLPPIAPEKGPLAGSCAFAAIYIDIGGGANIFPSSTFYCGLSLVYVISRSCNYLY
jgi:hypothetical protein